jgi:hypothetical protein
MHVLIFEDLIQFNFVRRLQWPCSTVICKKKKNISLHSNEYFMQFRENAIAIASIYVVIDCHMELE